MKNRTRFSLLALAAIFVAGCAALGSVTKKIGQATGQSKLVDAGESMERSAKEFTESEKYYVGRTVAAQLLTSRKPSNATSMEAYIGRVGQTVAQASGKPQLFKGWHFILIEGEAPEAFACPGGDILITTALVKLCSTEDELAAVLAHESSHVALDHPMAAITASNRKAALVGIVQFGVSQAARNSELSNLTGVFDGVIKDVGTAVGRGYDKSKEYEADKTAVAILLEVGYDPRSLAAVLRKLPSTGSAHGDPKKRAAELDSLTAKMKGIPETAEARTKRFARGIGGIEGGTEPAAAPAKKKPKK